MLLGLQVRTSESAAAWRAMTEDLARRGVTAPVLAVIDGNAGLREAVKTTWPWIEVQRCTKHKLENLATHAPKRQYEAVKADYHAIVYAESEAEARAAWGRFERRWEKTCPDLVRSLREGGEELLTFLRWPKAMWKRLRTTNAIERLNEEFRRRVKTQGSFPNAEAGLNVLYGLLACGVITLRRLDAWPLLAAAVETRRVACGLKKPLAQAG
jgi:transposase-like protein